MSMPRFELYSGWVYSGSGFIQIKLSRLIIRSVLIWVQFGSGSGCPYSVHFDSGHFGRGSFQLMLEFGFRSIMDQVTSRVRV